MLDSVMCTKVDSGSRTSVTDSWYVLRLPNSEADVAVGPSHFIRAEFYGYSAQPEFKQFKLDSAATSRPSLKYRKPFT